MFVIVGCELRSSDLRQPSVRLIEQGMKAGVMVNIFSGIIPEDPKPRELGDEVAFTLMQTTATFLSQVGKAEAALEAIRQVQAVQMK